MSCPNSSVVGKGAIFVEVYFEVRWRLDVYNGNMVLQLLEPLKLKIVSICVLRTDWTNQIVWHLKLVSEYSLVCKAVIPLHGR